CPRTLLHFRGSPIGASRTSRDVRRESAEWPKRSLIRSLSRALTRTMKKVERRAEHPIVRTHLETGKKCLFVNRFFTTHIVGLRKNESDAILEMLYRHIETPELSMRFKWTPNSVAFWDNRCTQHHALWDYYPHRRYGHRVTVCGQKPY